MTTQSTQPAGDGVAAIPANARSNRIESFDCYRLAVEFSTLACTLVPRGHGALRDQLERASTSLVLNLAEGFGRWQPREKAHHYAIARGSLLESGAAVDLLRARQLVSEIDCDRARALCTRVGQMLGGLIRSVERRYAMVGRG